jgi:hypothetical protein
MLADILQPLVVERWDSMGKSKDKPTATIETLRPYVKRAMEDPELRDDLVAAFITARSLYSQIGKREGVKAKAQRATDKDFQEDLQGLVAELTTATDRLQGKAPKKAHKARNRVMLLTGMTLGVLYNPWTGPATREWIMEQVAGGNGDGFKEFSDAVEADAASMTDTLADTTASAADKASDTASDAADKIKDAAADAKS